MKKILIALDNHNTYNLISNKGGELARALGASITLLHVFPDTITMTTSPDAFSGLYGVMDLYNMEQGLNLEGQLATESKKFLEQVKLQLNDDTAEIVTTGGNVAEAILESAANCKADIIVMGRHSRSGIGQMLMGSVTSEVLQHSHLPVFVIPVKDEV